MPEPPPVTMATFSFSEFAMTAAPGYQTSGTRRLCCAA
jgi:hypothetical protein